MSSDLPIFIIYEIGILIIVASISSELLKRIHLPGLIGPILVGLIIGGPGGLGLVTNLTVVNLLGILGSVLILFVVGLEFEAATFWRAGKVAFLLTTGGVVLSLTTGYLIGVLLGWSTAAALLLGAVMAPSGTTVVASVLNAEDRLDSKAGHTVLTACIVDDVEGVLILTVALALLTQQEISIYQSTRLVAIALLFIFASLYIGGKVMPSFISRFSKVLSDEVLFAIFLGGGLVLAFAASQIGLAAITGAFLMGAVIPYSKVGEKLSYRMFFMKEIFAAIFFASIGLTIDPRDLVVFFPVIVLVCITAIVARLTGGLIAGIFAGLRGRVLSASLLGLAIRAEMSLIIAREAASTGIIGSEFLSVASSAVILSMVLITPIFRYMIRKA